MLQKGTALLMMRPAPPCVLPSFSRPAYYILLQCVQLDRWPGFSGGWDAIDLDKCLCSLRLAQGGMRGLQVASTILYRMKCDAQSTMNGLQYRTSHSTHTSTILSAFQVQWTTVDHLQLRARHCSVQLAHISHAGNKRRAVSASPRQSKIA